MPSPKFSDLELRVRYFNAADDQPNWQALVKDLQNHYQEIMIDEYQDTNRLQESILMKLTSPEHKNLFMVGMLSNRFTDSVKRSNIISWEISKLSSR